ncbi:MAG: hypothetical protein JWO02_4427 [Solirubrobacterales bacterium]|nr:hypothetical protein [Solirubrobacterales bacterium]
MKPVASSVPRLVALAVLASFLAVPPVASARGGSDGGGGGGGGRKEVRVSGGCGHGATSKLKLKEDDGAIEVEFEVDHTRTGTSWRITLVRERRVVARTTARTRGNSGSFTIQRRLSDLSGADRITARAVGPRGLTCQAAATLPG